MPIPLQIVASLLVGLVLALAAHRQAAQGRSAFAREGLVPLFYEVLLVFPTVVYLCLVHPAWSWLYLVDPQRMPFGIVVLVLVGNAAAAAGGYLGGWMLVKTQRRRELSIGTAVLALFFVLTLVLLRERLLHAGTYAEQLAGAAATLGSRKLGWAVGIIDAGLVVGLVLSVSFLVEQGERER